MKDIIKAQQVREENLELAGTGQDLSDNALRAIERAPTRCSPCVYTRAVGPWERLLGPGWFSGSHFARGLSRVLPASPVVDLHDSGQLEPQDIEQLGCFDPLLAPDRPLHYLLT